MVTSIFRVDLPSSVTLLWRCPEDCLLCNSESHQDSQDWEKRKEDKRQKRKRGKFRKVRSQMKQPLPRKVQKQVEVMENTIVSHLD